MPDSKEKRTKIVKVRFTETEYSYVKMHCPRTELARWLREMAVDPTSDWVLSEQRKRVDIPKVDPDLLRHLSAIGNNLNQLTKAVHAGLGPISAISLFSELQKINLMVDEVRARDR